MRNDAALIVIPDVRSGRAPAAGLAVAGTVALLARPWLASSVAHPTVVLVLVFVGLGAVGAWWPVPGTSAPAAAPSTWSSGALVAAVGLGAFLAGRLLAGGRAAAPALALYLVLNTLAAVAEEAFFRRLLYGLLVPYGAGVAVAGSAAAFAIVHVTVWGAWAVPLDLAAGLVLSWQRWASGRWSIPALTHAAANVMAVV